MVGLSSYLLISYWFTRIETSLGGILAILMNRIGDVFYLLGILISLLLYNSVDILTLISNTYINNDILLFFFFLAAMAKSAQIFLHIWLPYSMEGPTPISALLHAATMVTAGVYLLLRLSLLISFSYYTIIFITIIGSLTTFIGGTLALTSLDMKELIAYSTMSQLGYMITIISLKYYNLAFFHLIFHAYFKALLFLTAGSIIHTLFDLQDLRLSGGILHFLPLSYVFALIGFTSLSGLPFTTGFYSKESIINSSFYSQGFLAQFIYLITIITALFTILYSYNFIINIFFSTTRFSLFLLKHLHYYSFHLTFSLIIISILTIFLGFFWSKFLYSYNLPNSFFVIYLPFYIKIIPILFLFIFFIFFISFTSSINSYIVTQQFYFKVLYATIAGSMLALSYRIFYKIFDYGFLDLLSPFTGHHFYELSKSIHNYLSKSYYFSLLFFFLYVFLFIF